MKEFNDPLKAAFMDLAIQDLQGGVKSEVGVSREVSIVESETVDKDSFARAALQDLGVKSATPVVIKESTKVDKSTSVEETSEKVVEQFMKEAADETAAVLKKMLKGLR